MKSSKRILSFSLALFGLSTMLAFADTQHIGCNTNGTVINGRFYSDCDFTIGNYEFETEGDSLSTKYELQVFIKDIGGNKISSSSTTASSRHARCFIKTSSDIYHNHGATSMPME